MRTFADESDGAGPVYGHGAGHGAGAPYGDGPFVGVTRKLLWANGIAFVATFLLDRFVPSIGGPLVRWLALDPDLWYGGVPAVWQLVTYGFLHDLTSPIHLLFNLLALYFFGTMLEGMVGSRRFAWQYFTAVILGGLVHLGLAIWMPGHPMVIGASGAVLYTVVACAVLQPTARVLFFFVPMQLKVMAFIVVGLNLFTMLAPGPSKEAWDVHLAGAGLGFLAARRGWVWFDPRAWRTRRVAERAREAEVSDQERLDRLLERIHREGMTALSARDREFLQRMSKRR